MRNEQQFKENLRNSSRKVTFERYFRFPEEIREVE